MAAPVESCRYLPTTLLVLARPLGCLCDFEFNNSRALSQALAASITTRPLTWYSCISSFLMNDTPVALPSLLLVITSRAMALAMTSTLPVLIAGFTRTDDDEKSAYATLQPLLHWPQ